MKFHSVYVVLQKRGRMKVDFDRLFLNNSPCPYPRLALVPISGVILINLLKNTVVGD